MHLSCWMKTYASSASRGGRSFYIPSAIILYSMRFIYIQCDLFHIQYTGVFAVYVHCLIIVSVLKHSHNNTFFYHTNTMWYACFEIVNLLNKTPITHFYLRQLRVIRQSSVIFQLPLTDQHFLLLLYKESK